MNQDADVKEVLKKIILGYLDQDASIYFINKCFAIIDESADSKESYMGAIASISVHITMFIDEDLAQRAYGSLMEVVKRMASPQGVKRRHKRVPFLKKVHARYKGEQHVLDSANLSEGGMFIGTKEPFPADSAIEITLPLEEGNSINLSGTVVYNKGPLGQTSKLQPGMAVEFKEIRADERKMLSDFVRRTTEQNFLEIKKKP